METTDTIENNDNIDKDSGGPETKPGVKLELGDIIEITAPSNNELNEIAAIITYIDESKIKLFSVSTAKFYKLNISEDGRLTDESIQQIVLLSRSEEPGYARQNNLLPKTWVDVHFGGEIPTIITGEITNLEEDMIEITTYPELQNIYINFGYKGIPEHIPIEKIAIRRKPASLGPLGSLSLLRQQLEEGEEYEPPAEELASMEFTETGESILNIPEGAKPDENIRDSLHNLYVDANSIIYGELLEPIAQLVEVPEGQQRYGIDAQVNDLMDELLSVIPNSQRTKLVLDNIHLLIERFKELRQKFSKFDINENIYDVKQNGAYYKPLVEHIQRIDTNLRWLVPVVSNRRKIYDAEFSLEMPDVINEKLFTGIKSITDMQDEYYKNNSKNQALNYSTMQNRIQEWWKPTDSNITEPESILTTSKVLTDLDTIVDNLGDFYSSVYNKSGVKVSGDASRSSKTKLRRRARSIVEEDNKRQYVIQRYNLGLSKLDEQVMKSGKIIYAKADMTPNDEISIKSMIMMPEPVVRFSTIGLPNTNILEKSTLHQNYFMLFRLLRKNTEIIPHIIEDLSKELDYEEMEKETKNAFLTGIHEFILDKDIYVDENEKFKKFLETIIPKTRFLIKAVSKHVKNNVSLVDVVKQLEPFMVYTNDITYPQYNEIRYFIKNRIIEFKKTVEQRFNEMSTIRNAKYNVMSRPNAILRLLTEKENFANAFFQTYHFLSTASTDVPEYSNLPRMGVMGGLPAKDNKDNKLSSQEILFRMTQMDNCNLYTNILTSIMISLMTPINLSDALNQPNLDDITDLEKIKPTDCARRYLAKKYDSIKALQKDNNVDELFYDKDMDDTPYDILKKYKDDQTKMEPELFSVFLMENLVHKHDCPKYMANDLARTLIANKKLVQDGDYAVLELKPKLPSSIDESSLTDKENESVEMEADIRKKIQYYRRLKNNWIKDDEIEDESFLDTNTIFCNISASCYKNAANDICESTDDAATRMKAIAKKKMLGEFDKRYSINVDELEVELERNIAYYLKILKKTNNLREIQSHKANNLAFELGNLANKNDLLFSPHMKLRDLILGQDDFSKKQYDICRFTENYCREPMEVELNEQANWLYCKDTNTKLFPISIYELAKTFISGGDYARKQNELCHSVGILSDDGDSIVDKHSGFVIRKIDFSEEEGFDEAGFKITTNDILETDTAPTLAAAPVLENAQGKKTKPVFENETTEMVYNVFSAICENIDIPIDTIDEFVLRTSNEFIERDILSEATYQKQSDANKKKTGNPFKTTYVNYRNETIIIIIACSILIAVQTVIPSFQTKRTFPGCVRSFSGYPMGGIEDLTGIQYMACVLDKTKARVTPWDSISKYKPDVLAKRMKDIIEKYIMKRSDITEMFVQKREYMLLNTNLIVPYELSVSKWIQFLPPVVDFTILNKIRNISSDFKDELMDLMREGKMDQYDSIYVVKSKIIQFGYSIIESINNIVKNKDALLQTSGRVPFIENACCNDRLNATNPLSYFNEENNTISTYVNAASQLATILKTVKNASSSSLLYDPEFTGIRYPSVPTGHLEENIYAAIIWHCNFDRNLPIPEECKDICSEKPANYDANWTIQEKMEFLKKNGKRYSVDSLNQIMNLVNKQNIITIDVVKPFSQVDILNEIIEKLELSDSTVIAEPLRKHLRNILNKYDPTKMTDKPSQELKNLTNYLFLANNELYTKIMLFFDKNGNQTNAEYNKLHQFLSNIQKWNLDRPMSETKSYFDEGLYTVCQYIQNAVQNFATIYPTILNNNADFYKKIPQHWNLSQDHNKDIYKFIEKYYSSIEKFKGDEVLMKLLQTVSERLVDVNLFVQNIPIHTEVVKEIIDTDTKEKTMQTFHSLFDKLTTYQLFSHCMYTTIYEYIVCSIDPELLRTDLQSFKNVRRAEIINNKNSSNTLASQLVTINEELANDDIELQEVQMIIGNPEELKRRTCSLLLAFLDVEENNKKSTDFSYDQIKQRVNRSKEKEKQGIMADLEIMSKEARSVENQLKKYRLGRWNVGQQSGLVKYDKDTYNRERDELMNQLLGEETGGTTDVVSNMLLDVYELEAEENDELNKQSDQEAYGIGDLGENYNDGEYYEEDRDQDDF